MHFEAFVYFLKCVVFLDLQNVLVTSSWVLKTVYLGIALLYSQVMESCTRKDAVSGLPEVVIHARNVSFERHMIEKQR